MEQILYAIIGGVIGGIIFSASFIIYTQRQDKSKYRTHEDSLIWIHHKEAGSMQVGKSFWYYGDIGTNLRKLGWIEGK